METEKQSSQPFSSLDEKSKALTLLLVSDIHQDTKKLEKLKLYFTEKFKRRVDYLLYSGDFDNLDNNGSNTEADTTSCDGASKLLSTLEFASVPIVYIPGNHDSPKLYKEKMHLTQQSILVQNEAYELAPGLQIVGLGGSVPGYSDVSGQWTKVWEGYPYSNDADYAEDLKKVTDKYCSNGDLQTILMTHVGPYVSSTSVDTESSENPIYGGSKALSQMLSSSKHNILLNLHGHIHYGTGRSNIKGIQVINPGSLSLGNFGVLELVKENVRNKWVVKQTEFISLNAF